MVAMATERFRVSTQILIHVVDQVESRGFDARELLESCHLSRDCLDDVERMVPLADYVRFFELAAQKLRDPYFGLHAAQAGVVGALGALSFLFMSAPTLGKALESLIQFLNVIQEGTRLELEFSSDQMIFIYQLRDSHITPRRQDSEYSIGSMFQLINAYLANDFSPQEIYFEHERLGAYKIYADYFRCNVFFGQSINAVLFDRSILETRSPRLSTRLYGLISAQLNAAMNDRERPMALSDRVSRLLTEDRLGKGVQRADIAALLDLSASGLSRRLDLEGRSFRSILLTKRIEVAERLLRESDQPISEIALRLGYGETASFSRAFRKMTGQTAEQFRLAGRGAGG